MTRNSSTRTRQRQRFYSLARTAAAGVLGLTVLTSCTVGPDYIAHNMNVPGAYGDASAFATTQPSAPRTSALATNAQPVSEWWSTLHDAELDKLVHQAESQNFDLHRATQRIVESRATLKLAGAQNLPTLSATPGFAELDLGKNSGFGDGIQQGVFAAGFDASWEFDIFGGTRRQIEAAAADYQASVEDRRDVFVSLTAEVARDYLQLRGLQERLRIARDNLALQQDTLALTQSLRKNGFNSQLDVSRAMTQVEQTKAQIVPLMTSVAVQEHAIATLLGFMPNELLSELSPAAPVPAVDHLVAIGLPSDLLRRRPDVRRAERQIAAANARVGEAISNYYPKFSINGDFGTDSTSFRGLFDWESHFLLLYPSVSWRLFDFGRTKNEVEQAKARYSQAIDSYKSTVLGALRDVEDAQVTYLNEQDHHGSLAAAVTSARESVSIARDQYKQGVSDFLQVLDAQRQLLAAQDELAQSDQAIATNLVALYKSLGGGWEAEVARQIREEAPAQEQKRLQKSLVVEGVGDPSLEPTNK